MRRSFFGQQALLDAGFRSGNLHYARYDSSPNGHPLPNEHNNQNPEKVPSPHFIAGRIKGVAACMQRTPPEDLQDLQKLLDDMIANDPEGKRTEALARTLGTTICSREGDGSDPFRLEDNECMICFEPMTFKDMILGQHCGHCLHVDCAKRTAQMKATELGDNRKFFERNEDGSIRMNEDGNPVYARHPCAGQEGSPETMEDVWPAAAPFRCIICRNLPFASAEYYRNFKEALGMMNDVSTQADIERLIGDGIRCPEETLKSLVEEGSIRVISENGWQFAVDGKNAKTTKKGTYMSKEILKQLGFTWNKNLICHEAKTQKNWAREIAAATKRSAIEQDDSSGPMCKKQRGSSSSEDGSASQPYVLD